jgi:PhzF family phenazine biosynthesis protein
MTIYDYLIVNAFTTDAFGGNPALVVFLPDNATLSTETLQRIALSWQQPIVSYIFPVSSSHSNSLSKNAEFGIRWFSVNREVPLCGHGTLAAAHALVASGRVAPDTELISFKPFLLEGRVISAKRLEDNGQRLLELELPATTLTEVTGDARTKITDIVRRALGKPTVQPRYIGHGGKGFEYYLLVVLDDAEVLRGCVVDTARFVSDKIENSFVRLTGFDRKRPAT